jgi:DMSO/TMAO reductase YedYZ heme-binding membrane subunit
MTRSFAERTRNVLAWVLTGLVAIALPLAAGFGFARLFAPTLHSRYFPWLTGRALGIAGYIALSALVILGVWMRHPWRLRRPLVHSETRLRVHAALATSTLALVAGHLVALASDKYAGVGWIGAFVPGQSQYRTLAVALGVIAMFFMVLLFATARSAGRFGARHWLTYHRFAVMTFALVWFHGVMAGTDTAALRVLYVLTGAAVALLTMTRYVAGRRSRDNEVVLETTPRSTAPLHVVSASESVAS